MSNELVADCPAFSFLRVTAAACILATRLVAGNRTRWRVACKVAPVNPALGQDGK
jgi:hypothetical protein